MASEDKDMLPARRIFFTAGIRGLHSKLVLTLRIHDWQLLDSVRSDIKQFRSNQACKLREMRKLWAGLS